jgi:hypothetical protein
MDEVHEQIEALIDKYANAVNKSDTAAIAARLAKACCAIRNMVLAKVIPMARRADPEGAREVLPDESRTYCPQQSECAIKTCCIWNIGPTSALLVNSI